MCLGEMQILLILILKANLNRHLQTCVSFIMFQTNLVSQRSSFKPGLCKGTISLRFPDRRYWGRGLDNSIIPIKRDRPPNRHVLRPSIHL